METLKGQVVIVDESFPVYAQIDYGKGIFISLGEDQWDESFENTDILNATFEFEDNLFTLTDIHTHHSYSFFEIKEISTIPS